MNRETRTGRPGAATSAVVAGAGFSGLVAAWVLSDHVDEVVMLDRDRLPDRAVPRDGVPHGHHAHPRLDGLPVLLSSLGLVAPPEIGDLPGLELAVRRQLARCPGVDIRDRTSVIDLELDRSGRVTGVRACDLDRPGRVDVLHADLVVDAAGRCSRTAAWIGRSARAVPVSVDRMHAVYLSRGFSGRSPDRLPVGVRRRGPRTVAVADRDPGWVVTLGGYDGERPPADPGNFVRWAATVWPELGSRLAELRGDEDVRVCRVPAALRRHYDRMGRPPTGLLAVGAALDAPDPMHEPGLAAAAAQGLVLRDVLADGPATSAGPAFFAAWAAESAAGQPLAAVRPGVGGDRVGRGGRRFIGAG